MAGKMSTGVRKIVNTPRRTMSNAPITNVYGRRKASRTIHMELPNEMRLMIRSANF